MIADHRTYTLRPGKVPAWMKKYETEGLPIQRKHLGKLIGIFTTEIGNLHQVVLIWAYDSLADRDQRREAMGADPAWQKYIGELWAMDVIQAQEIKILKLALFLDL